MCIIAPIFVIVMIFILLFISNIILCPHYPMQSTLKSITNGIFALVTINLSSGFTGVFLPLNLLTLGVSSILGIPGVSTLLLIKFILV